MNCKSIQIDFTGTNHVEKHVIIRSIEDPDDQRILTVLMNKLTFSRPKREPAHASLPNLDRLITFTSPVYLDAFRTIYDFHLTQFDRDMMNNVINGAKSIEVKGEVFVIWLTNPTYRIKFEITIGDLHVNATLNTKKD